MKRSNKITRVRLEIDNTREFILLGISSSEPDYRLSLILNQTLGTTLRNVSPVLKNQDNGTELIFSKFSGTLVNPEYIIDLISNRSAGDFLIRKFKNIDYIIQIYGLEDDFDITGMIRSLREINSITGVFILDTNNISEKNLKFPV
jgi:hypothetical protein